MSSIRSVITNQRPGSLLYRVRRKRFKFFIQLINQLKKPIKILDAGGEVFFWDQMGISQSSKLEITLLNIQDLKVHKKYFSFIKGDAAKLDKFVNLKKFDIIFSNSLIEHLQPREQLEFANKVKKSGTRYFIQTPNKYFPIEPHLMFPLFQFLPKSLRIFLISHFSLGFFNKQNKQKSRQIVESINMLGLAEIKKLFPEAKIFKEKFLFFNKSYTAYWGF
jgi:hypothetical protein